MEKVFLVEDEVVVREGIKKNIDWASNGLEFCGEARDGELAFPLIQKLRPDIVITDIKMPFMDGLTLSKLIKKELPETEIIILTGYEEFEYAKEAIKIGVLEYLTKPISSEDLLIEVNKAADKVREKRKEQDLKEKYNSEMIENSRMEKADLFQNLVSGKCSMSELLDMAEKTELDISAVWYNLILFRAQSTKHAQDEYSESYVDLEKKLIVLCESLGSIHFDRNLDGHAILIKADSEEELEAKQRELIEKVENMLQGYKHIAYFGGVGTSVNRMTSIAESFESASRAFAHRYFVADNKFLYSKDSNSSVSASENDEFNIRDVDISRVDKSRIEEFLKVGSSDELQYFVEDFTENVGDHFMDSLMFRQYIVMDTYFRVVSFVESLSHSRDEISSIDMQSGVLNSSESSIKYIEEILAQGIALREATASNKYGEVVDRAMNYIKENYGEEELSLNTLASYVNMSPNHLSMIFSQQTGQTFIKYLTDYRINKAKELLRCTSKKSSEICEEVGYRDPHYFSYLFKKSVGVTPTQYRSGNEE